MDYDGSAMNVPNSLVHGQSRLCEDKHKHYTWRIHFVYALPRTEAIGGAGCLLLPCHHLVEPLEYTRGRSEVHPRLAELAALAVLQHVVHGVRCAAGAIYMLFM